MRALSVQERSWEDPEKDSHGLIREEKNGIWEFDEKMDNRSEKIKLYIALDNEPIASGCLILWFEDNLSNFEKYFEKINWQGLQIEQLKDDLEKLTLAMASQQNFISTTSVSSTTTTTRSITTTEPTTIDVVESSEISLPSHNTSIIITDNPIDQESDYHPPVFAATFISQNLPTILGVLGVFLLFLIVISFITYCVRRKRTQKSYALGRK